MNVYIVTDGEVFKAFCEGRRTKVMPIAEEGKTPASWPSFGNPYLVFGKKIKKWLGLPQAGGFDNIHLIVAHVTSGALTYGKG